MADTIRIKRRATPGASGPPSALANAELAFNENDDTLYYGVGGTPTAAASIIAVGGPGAFAPITRALPPGGTAGQVLAKNTATNYDAAWVTGAGGATGPAGPMPSGGLLPLSALRETLG